MTSWARIQYVASTGSTNADMVAAARSGAPHGTILVSEHQSSGRGRFDRVWETPPGVAVAVSAVLRPPTKAQLSWLPLVVGLAVSDALLKLGVEAQLKWPNDVLIDGKKICGILVERVDTKLGWACVAGLGINVSMTEEQLPVPNATSLLLEGKPVANRDVVAAVVDALGRRYAEWIDGVDLLDAYSERCATLGKEIRIHISDESTMSGLAVGISKSGCLLANVGGEIREFSSGDVYHLR